MFKRFIASLICLTFSFSNLQNVHAQDFSVNQLPVPGTMVGISDPFTPLTLKGIVINPSKPLEFQFLVDTGRGPQDIPSIKDQSNQLVKYFLAGLTIPEGDLWVNLSPYEKDRMIPEALGQTELGRDLLAQDYILKQLTASLIYPEKNLGKEFWGKVYAKVQAQFGTTNVPIDTFNKVWILPDQAQVYINTNAAYVTKATLKVMLDEDYKALYKHTSLRGGEANEAIFNRGVTFPRTHTLASQIVRQIILPQITVEVNKGKNFANLRQIYNALILAKWYKETIRNSLIDAVYTNKNKIAGVNVNDPAVKEEIYRRYLQAYKKGAFNYIKEDPTPDGQVLPRKYFSGGFVLRVPLRFTRNPAMISRPDGAMLSITVDAVNSSLARIRHHFLRGLKAGVMATTVLANLGTSANAQSLQLPNLNPPATSSPANTSLSYQAVVPTTDSQRMAFNRLVTAARGTDRQALLDALNPKLNPGVDVNGLGSNDETALMAAAGSNPEFVGILISKGGSVTAKNAKGNTAFVYAADKNTAASEREIIAVTEDINEQNADGSTDLILASKNGQKDVVDQILKLPGVNVSGVHVNERNINAIDAKGYTALMYAVQGGYASIVQALLAERADTNIIGRDSRTALSIARGETAGPQGEAIIDANNTHPNIEEALLEAGARDPLSDKERVFSHLLALASSDTDLPRLKVMLTNGVTIGNSNYTVDVNGTSIQEPGLNALMVAGYYQQIATIKALLDAGANLDQKDETGNTFYDYAFSKNDKTFEGQVIDEVIAKHGNLNVTLKSGQTLLVNAIENNNLGLVKELVIAGADTTIPNNQGVKPAQVAKIIDGKNGNDDFEEILNASSPKETIASSGNALVVSNQNVSSAPARPFYVWRRPPLHTPQSVAGVKASSPSQQRSFDNLVSAAKGSLDGLKNALDPKQNPGVDINGYGVDGITPLIAAVQSDKIDNVQYLIAEGANVEVKDNTPGIEFTPFGYAAKGKGFTDIENALIDAPSYVLDTPNGKGYTDLILASSSGQVAIMQKLLDKGSDPDIQDKYFGYSALMSAVVNAQTDAVTLLLTPKYNIKVNAGRNVEGLTALALARQNRYKNPTEYDKIIAALIDAGGKDPADPKQQAIDNMVVEAEEGNISAVQQALAAGVDINSTETFSNISALEEACSKRNIQMVQFLFAQGADVNEQDIEGNTAFQYAAFYQYADVEKMLIDRPDFKVNLRLGLGLTPLRWAAQDGQNDIVQELIDKDADITAVADDGSTILDSPNFHADTLEIIKYALKVPGVTLQTIQAKEHSMQFSNIYDSQNWDALRAFINADGFDPNGIAVYPTTLNGHPYGGETYLSLAAMGAPIDILQLLLDKGAKVDLPSPDGETALERAAWAGKKDAVEFLIKNGADVNYDADPFGEGTLVPLSVAKNPDVIALLKAAGGTDDDMGAWKEFINSKGFDVDGRFKVLDAMHASLNKETYLTYAAINGKIELMQLLLDKGANINLPNADGKTPLMRAVQYSKIEAVKFLIEKGANVNAETSKNETALQIAKELQNDFLIKTLKAAGATDNTASNGNSSTPASTTNGIGSGASNNQVTSNLTPDHAMLSQNNITPTVDKNGGIDLYQIQVSRTGTPVNLRFDQAQLNTLIKSNFGGFSPLITSIILIQSPLSLLENASDISPH